ncbi:MAG: hypothetical protein Q4F17_11030 [Eubacteriales bacterium]|nr:hypothetical protein [Eubacteriales bacterium]
MTIEFPMNFSADEAPDLYAMTRRELEDYLQELHERLEDLDAREPKNMDSQAYDDWADAHEDLEDLLDEVRDRLEEM